jgi:hypothetical protein
MCFAYVRFFLCFDEFVWPSVINKVKNKRTFSTIGFMNSNCKIDSYNIWIFSYIFIQEFFIKKTFFL